MDKREQFEAWAKGKFDLTIHARDAATGRYFYNETWYAWCAWQAAQSAPGEAVSVAVNAHCADLRRCVPTLREYGMHGTAKEVEKSISELEAALASPTAQPERDGREKLYQQICAAAYQMAGVVDAPVRFLDALGDAANGEPGKRVHPDALLPVNESEFQALSAQPMQAKAIPSNPGELEGWNAAIEAAAKVCDELSDETLFYAPEDCSIAIRALAKEQA